MAGDTKSDELFYLLTQKENFQRDVRECRKAFGIPLEGFRTEKQAAIWYEKLVGRYSVFLGALDHIMRGHKLSELFVNPLEEYVITNKNKILYPERPYPFCEMDTSNGSRAQQYRNIKKPFVSVLIYEYASLKEAQHFLKETWRTIQVELETQRGKRMPRIRRSAHKERDQAIFDLYIKSRADLGLKKGGYKEIRVANLISEKYGRIQPEHVKKIVSKMRKLKSNL